MMAPTGIQNVMQPRMSSLMGSLMPVQEIAYALPKQPDHPPCLQLQGLMAQQQPMLFAQPPQKQQQFQYSVGPSAQQYQVGPTVQPCSRVGSHELVAAVESLYRDGLKPYGRILRKRLAEQSQAMGRGAAEMDVNSLRAACDSCPYLHVRDGEGGDWAALLPGLQEAFVDVYSPQDCYPQELWQDIARYFASLDGADMILPGGRYSCAQVLVQRRLPCLAGCSLGQVCHIVQLAISQKKLLGYLNGTVVPYSRSLSMVKEQSAKCQRPCSNTVRRSKSAAFATWDMMRPCLQQLLGSIGQPMPLSNVKRLFRAQFHVELSETALGYAKLSECLQDPRVRDLCDVKLQGQGYTIIPAKKQVQRSLISLADSLCMEPRDTVELKAADEGGGSRSLLHKRRGAVQPLSMDVIQSPETSPRSAVPSQLFATTPSRGSVHGVMTPVQTPYPPTPSPSASCVRSLPRLLGRIQPPTQLCNTKGVVKEGSPAIPAPVCCEQPGAQGIGAVRCGDLGENSRGMQQLGPLTSSTLGTMGLSVHNTFLHAPLPPPTPVRTHARSRARSLPRSGI